MTAEKKSVTINTWVAALLMIFQVLGWLIFAVWNASAYKTARDMKDSGVEQRLKAVETSIDKLTDRVNFHIDQTATITQGKKDNASNAASKKD